MLRFKTVHPHPDESYRVAVDDGCFALKPPVLTKDKGFGVNRKAMPMWVSPSMVIWLYKNLKKIDPALEFKGMRSKWVHYRYRRTKRPARII